MRVHLVLIALSMASILLAQRSGDRNLIPNPGFEEYTAIPNDWFYTGDDFSRTIRYWESPTGASPDAYAPQVYVPRHWREKGFGQATPHSGQSMVGITVYGCHGGKPHCREYVQVELYEALVADQRYELSYWVQHLPRSLQINNLRAAFSRKRIALQSDDLVVLTPVGDKTGILSADPGDWIECKVEFYADSTAGYLVIGNFEPDEYARVRKKCDGECLPFAYYYIDDLLLKKLPPILPIPLAENDLSKVILEEGKTIRLNYVFFDSGKADFLPRSFNELYTLLEIMQMNPEMAIEVRGHTDNLGSLEFNTELSIRRARNVVLFLEEHGVASGRLTYQGFASANPIADNNTDEGRKKNRRVEFHILKM